MEISWKFREISVRFPWGFREISVRFPWPFATVAPPSPCQSATWLSQSAPSLRLATPLPHDGHRKPRHGRADPWLRLRRGRMGAACVYLYMADGSLAKRTLVNTYHTLLFGQQGVLLGYTYVFLLQQRLQTLYPLRLDGVTARNHIR